MDNVLTQQQSATIIDQVSEMFSHICKPKKNLWKARIYCARRKLLQPLLWRMCVCFHVYEACIDCRVSAELSFEKKKGNERKKMKWEAERRVDAAEDRKQRAGETNISAELCSLALNEHTQTQVKIKYRMQLFRPFSPFNLSFSLLTCWQHPPIPRQLESKCVFWRDSLSQHHSLPSKVSFKLDLYAFAM